LTDTRPDTETAGAPAPAPPPEHPPVEARGEIAGGGWRLALVVALVASVGVLTRASILVVILAIVVMIFFHELGHYLTAKWSGMKVTEFFIGFGPRIWSFHRGETEYGLKAIPAGAYVRIIGMSNMEEVPPEDERRTYRQQSYPKRMLVVLAGSAMHFLMALVCLFALMVSGIPGGTVFDLERQEAAFDQLDAGPWVVGEVIDGSAAAGAGVEPGDVLVGIAGDRVELWSDVPPAVVSRGGEQVTVEVLRDGQPLTLTADIGERDGRGFFGIGPEFTTDISQPLGVGEAGYRSVVELGMGLKVSTEALGTFFTGGIGDMARQVVSAGRVDGSPAVGEPGGDDEGAGARGEGEGRIISIVGATQIGADLTETGWQGLFRFLVMINLFVGLFNLIPLLPLDGGHAAVATYERIRSRRGHRHMADMSRLIPVTYAVFMAIVLLGLSALYLDIVSPVSLG
jgi:membrane-associated protease RseP (regulator of RpoE activity)